MATSSCQARKYRAKIVVIVTASIALSAANCQAYNFAPPSHHPLRRRLQVQGERSRSVTKDINHSRETSGQSRAFIHSVITAAVTSAVFVGTLFHHDLAAIANDSLPLIPSESTRSPSLSQQTTGVTNQRFSHRYSIVCNNFPMLLNVDMPSGRGVQPSSPIQKQSLSAINHIYAPTKIKKGELQVTNLQKIAQSNRIDVELIDVDDQRPLDAVKIDRETFTKVIVYQPPPFLQYLPSSVQPLVLRQFQSLKVLKSIPNEQLFVASVFAGSLTEIIRTVILYPISTVKSRVQARKSRSGIRRPLKQLRLSWLAFLYETKRGNWYDGLLPSLLLTVPASGLYSGAKEVSRRAFSMVIQVQGIQTLFSSQDPTTVSYVSSLVVNVLAAFCADIAALTIRTPADVLSIRLQVFGKRNVRSDFGDWAKDSAALLPAMIITDTPFLLSRVFLNAAIITSGENLGRYELETVAIGSCHFLIPNLSTVSRFILLTLTIACLCAFLTTPFDVARTRILLPTLPSEEGDISNQSTKRRLVDSSENQVLATMKRVVVEGNGGVRNLYAGWLERTLFLGVGRAWLDPFRVIGYLGIRDALLLKLFD